MAYKIKIARPKIAFRGKEEIIAFRGKEEIVVKPDNTVFITENKSKSFKTKKKL